MKQLSVHISGLRWLTYRCFSEDKTQDKMSTIFTMWGGTTFGKFSHGARLWAACQRQKLLQKGRDVSVLRCLYAGSIHTSNFTVVTRHMPSFYMLKSFKYLFVLSIKLNYLILRFMRIKPTYEQVVSSLDLIIELHRRW